MLPQLQAERQLLAIEAASMAHPNIAPRARAAVIDGHMRLLRGAGPIRAHSMVEALTAAGISVKHVPRKVGQPGTRRKGKRG